MSHKLYKVKDLDNGRPYCKAQIAPHGYHHSEKDSLKTHPVMCPLIGVCILLSICALEKWYLTKVYIKMAFCSLSRHHKMCMGDCQGSPQQTDFICLSWLLHTAWIMPMLNGSSIPTTLYSVWELPDVPMCRNYYYGEIWS